MTSVETSKVEHYADMVLTIRMLSGKYVVWGELIDSAIGPEKRIGGTAVTWFETWQEAAQQVVALLQAYSLPYGADKWATIDSPPRVVK